MPLRPPRRINVPVRKPKTWMHDEIEKDKKSETPQVQEKKESHIPVDTTYSPEYTAGKFPYNLRAAYVAYLQAAQVSLVLKELDTFRCEQGEVRPEDHRLVKEARDKIDEFCNRLARKLKLVQ
jgi:hypothetical protein